MIKGSLTALRISPLMPNSILSAFLRFATCLFSAVTTFYIIVIIVIVMVVMVSVVPILNLLRFFLRDKIICYQTN